ncbi:MAG: MMPL family transporter, partial [Deltaproteobacteria bacterium]|nr:MMPL family transporter [Deltaproteobacteria bacterium]
DRTILLSGTPVMDEAFYRYTERDFSVFAPLAVIVVIFCTFIIFRRISASLIPLTVVALALIFVFGLMGALQIKINVITTSLIALVLAVGVASTIHIIADYYQQLMAGRSRDEAVNESILTVITPCFFTAATTAAGMLSLMVSNLKPIRQFGWLAALAVIIAFVLSFTLVPVILRLVKPPGEAFILRQKKGMMGRAISLMGDPSRTSSIAILLFTVVLVLVSAYGISLLEVGINPINYYRKSDPILKEALAVDKALGGSITIEGMVTAPGQGLKDPEILQRLDDLERWFESLPGITHVLSPVDTLKEINRVFHDGNKAHFILPDSQALAAQYFLLMEGEEDFDSAVQDDYSVARVTARAELVNAQDLAIHIPDIENKISEEYQTDELTVIITGFVKLLSDMEQYLLASQIRSFSLAFTVITLMMFLLLRSLRLTLFSMIPNLAPIAMGLAFMGIAGISLDPGTVMIGSIAMGLVVDDTVHFLVRLRRRLKAGDSMQQAIRWSMHSTGRPIMVTSFVLASGCLVLTLGSFAPNIYFGAISSLIIVLALICDLVVLPAALIIIRPKI